MTRVGLGYRKALFSWLKTNPTEVEFLEFTAEHFFDGGLSVAKELRKRYPCALHGLGLSLGSPAPIDKKTLRQFAKVSRALDPEWVSEHVSFTQTGEVDLGHLNPIAPTYDNARLIAEKARQVMDATEKPLALENITSHLLITGELEEPEFLNLICRLSGADLLLDVTNLFVNAKNHRFDPIAYFRRLDPDKIRQLHIVGYSQDEKGRWHDEHAEAIQEDLMDFTLFVLRNSKVAAVVIERDSRFPHPHSLASELYRLKHEP